MINNAQKIVLLCSMPIFGGLLYGLFKSYRNTKRLYRRLLEENKELIKPFTEKGK